MGRGKISQEWLLLYDESRTNKHDTQRYSAQYIWGANIVEITLRQLIKLWEIRNTQVHGTTDGERQRIMKHRQIAEFKRLMSYKPDVRPSDLCFFPDDAEEFIAQSTAQQLRDYISMHRKAFENSRKQWKQRSVDGVQSITEWLRGIGSNAPRIQRTEQRHRARVLNSSFPRTRQTRTKNTNKDEPEPGQRQIRRFMSQRRQIQRNAQRHRERARTAKLNRGKQNRQQRQTTDESETGQTQIRRFLSRRCQQTKQPTVIRQHSDPLMYDAWNKKKKHKQIDNTTERTKKSRQLQLTGFFSLHSRI